MLQKEVMLLTGDGKWILPKFNRYKVRLIGLSWKKII